MPIQDVDCQKCGCSNKLGTIFCRNCGTKLKFSKALLNTQKSQKVKKTVKRALKAAFVLAIIAVIFMAFCPWGFPTVQKITDKEEIAAVITTCQEIDDALTKESSNASYEFTAPEATLAANYLSLEHEKSKKKQQASMSFSSGGLGSTGKMGGSSLGGDVSLDLPDKSAAPTETSPSYAQSENARLIAWRKRKQEDRIKAGKPILSEHFDFIITVKDDKTLCIVLKEIWMKFIPARLEICVVPKLKINAKERTQVLEYEITSARLGLLPIPIYFKDHVISLFEEMLVQEREWAKNYFSKIKNIEIVNENINVTFGK